jgi:hypothetical protein
MRAWIARDFDGTIRVFGTKPERHKIKQDMDTSSSNVSPRYEVVDGWWGDRREGVVLHPNTFKDQKWSNEPREVVLKVH